MMCRKSECQTGCGSYFGHNNSAPFHHDDPAVRYFLDEGAGSMMKFPDVDTSHVSHCLNRQRPNGQARDLPLRVQSREITSFQAQK